jgi:protein gp37
MKGFARIPRNIWMMVSAEDQERADERVNDLIHVPAIVRGISAEPLLGAINFSFDGIAPKSATPAYIPVGNMIGWMIVGGESGPGARPMHPDWARSIRSQCQEYEVPFLFKQWGEFAPFDCTTRMADASCETGFLHRDGTYWYWKLVKGRRPHFDGHVSDIEMMMKVGKKAAGRLFDGQEWNGYPEINL